MATIKKTIPGLALSFLIAFISQLLTKIIPNIGGATIAILIGIGLGNTVFKQRVWSIGTKFAEKSLLEYSVFLLGLTITFQTIINLHLNGLFFIIIQMAITIIGAIIIGKALAFNDGVYLSMAGGNAVCGSSAISSIRPVIGAKDDEAEMSITVVNLLGTVLMLVLPILGTALFGSDNFTRGALIGGTVQSVGQVVAGATMVNQETVQVATLFKILRIVMLIVVVIIFGKIHQRNVKKQSVGEEVEKEVQSKKTSILPWYVLVFFLFCILNSIFHLPTFIGNSAHFLSTWFENIALAAIGLRLNLSSFLKAGKRLAIYSTLVGLLQVVSAIVLIYILIR